MKEAFDTVIILSVIGFIVSLSLLSVKPFMLKLLPAKWQRILWMTALFSMLVPIYKFIPRIDTIERPETEVTVENTYFPKEETSYIQQPITPTNTADVQLSENNKINLNKALPLIWLSGALIYISVFFISYIKYIIHRKRNSVFVAYNTVFEQAKKELNIKRNIKLRISFEKSSPALIGFFAPTVYIPNITLDDENMRMVFLHELTHYKHKDLLFKWLALFCCAIHFFNPLVYFVCSNFSESCEIACDMSVTSKMTDGEKVVYMKTILEMLE